MNAIKRIIRALEQAYLSGLTAETGGWIACSACNGQPLNHTWCKSCGGYGKVLEFPKC
jgi:hypothetical protein